MRSNAIKEHLDYIYDVTEGDFAERILVCGTTIHPLITGGLIAGRNGILVESLLRENNFRVSIMLL